MIRTKEITVGVQATFNLGNYQSIKVTRKETVEVTDDDLSLDAENELRARIISRVKDDARVYVHELFNEKLS